MAASRYQTLSFLSDYGTADEFVGVVKSVVRTIAPDTLVIDISHEIAPHDVRAGGLALARSAQYLAPGVVLAVVDPGVGTERRAVAIEVGDGASVLVGPDNGLLAPAVAMVGGATRAVALTDDSYHLPSPGPTFAGRDVFAPAAAHLCAGVPFDALGPAVDTGGLRPGVLPVSRIEGDAVVAEVFWVDRFGNAQLNIGPEELEAMGGERVRLRTSLKGADGLDRTAVVAPTYGALGAGDIGLVVDSYGLVSISLDRRDAATELGISAGDQVTLEPLGDDDRPAAGPATPVELGRRR
ncbi:SAM-dependent chlorinase/fluorinase [soil metagenome]